jgi:hypothetical protein
LDGWLASVLRREVFAEPEADRVVDRFRAWGFAGLPLVVVGLPVDFLATVIPYLSFYISNSWVDPSRPVQTSGSTVIEVALVKNPDTIVLADQHRTPRPFSLAA